MAPLNNESSSTTGTYASDGFEVSKADYDHDETSLYRLIAAKNWNSALDSLEIDQAEARKWIVRYHAGDVGAVIWRFLPLHSACSRQPTTQFMISLIDAFPDAAVHEDSYGM